MLLLTELHTVAMNEPSDSQASRRIRAQARSYDSLILTPETVPKLASYMQ